MSIFIPYNPDSPTTNSIITPHPDFVTAGEQLRVKVTGSYAGVSDLTKTADATLEVAPQSDLTPGSTSPSSWPATSAAVVDDPASNPLVADLRVAVGSFIEAPVTATESSTIDVSVIADHANGVDRVEFIANEGTAFSVSTEALRTSWDAGSDWSADNDLPNSSCYTATLDLSAQAAGDPVEIRAIIYPTHGIPLVLQGDGTNNPAVWSSDGKTYEGTNSVFFTKVAETVTVDVNTSDGLRDAIDSQTFDATKQYVFSLTQALSEWSSGPDLSIDVNPYVPVIVRGSIADRGVSTYHAACPTNSPPTVAQPKTLNATNASGGIFWQFENLSIYQGTTAFIHNAGNGSIIRDCIITREAEIVTDFKNKDISLNNTGGTWTEGGSVPSVVLATRFQRDQDNFDESSDALICIKDAVVCTTPANVGNGTYLLESTVEHNNNLGAGVVLQRNVVHQANLQDVSSAQTILNILVRDSAFGGEVPFTVGGDTRVWDTNGSANPFDSSVVDIGTVPLDAPDPEGANIPYLVQDMNPSASVPSPNWSVYMKYYTAAYVNESGVTVPSVISYGRLDPHVDIWQPPVSPPTIGPGSGTPTKTSGWFVVQNTILQGVKATDVNLQPFIDTQWGSGYPSVVHNGTVFKDWSIEGQQVVASTTKSRTFNSMYNYLWRNVNFNPDGTEQYMGQFIFQQDLAGESDFAALTGDTDPSSGGAHLDMTIIDSTLSNFDADADTNMSQGDTLADWVSQEVEPTDSSVRVVNSTGTYGLNKPTGGITISGLAAEGSSLSAVTSISNADSETLQWSIADTELGTYTDISGATGSTYLTVAADSGKYIKCTVTATGLPPALVADSNIIGPIAGGVLELGGFTRIWGDNSTPQVLHKVTDDNGRTGTFLQGGRGGGLNSNSSTVYIGPGMVDDDDAVEGVDSDTGIYLTATYKYTANNNLRTATWKSQKPNGMAGTVYYRWTVTKPDGTVIIDEHLRDFSTLGNQGGYINQNASQTGWTPSFMGSTTLDPIENGDSLRIDAYFVAD